MLLLLLSLPMSLYSIQCLSDKLAKTANDVKVWHHHTFKSMIHVTSDSASCSRNLPCSRLKSP